MHPLKVLFSRSCVLPTQIASTSQNYYFANTSINTNNDRRKYNYNQTFTSIGLLCEYSEINKSCFGCEYSNLNLDELNTFGKICEKIGDDNDFHAMMFRYNSTAVSKACSKENKTINGYSNINACIGGDFVPSSTTNKNGMNIILITYDNSTTCNSTNIVIQIYKNLIHAHHMMLVHYILMVILAKL